MSKNKPQPRAADERPNADRRKLPQCQATNRTTGKRCIRNVQQGSLYCRAHGGGAEKQTGIASPNFKHGQRTGESGMQRMMAGQTRWAASVPARLAEHFQRSLADDTQLSLQPELALIDAMTAELIGDMDKDGYPTLFAALAEMVETLEEAEENSNPSAMAKAIVGIKRLVKQGGREAERRTEIRELIKDRKALAESERKHRIEQGLMVSIMDMATLLGIFIGIIQRNVSDEAERATILAECERTIMSKVMPTYGATAAPVVTLDGVVV